MKNLSDEFRNPVIEQRAHLERGVFREAIERTLAEAVASGLSANEALFAAVLAGSLSLVKNRSAELEGLPHSELARLGWEKMRLVIPALRNQRDLEVRKEQTVAFVTRALGHVALQHWKSRAISSPTWTTELSTR
jgi:hypothetical protein